jgi:multidrug transporter EmrE-like cation transporter
MKKTSNYLFIFLAILFQAISGVSGKYAALSISVASSFPLNLITNVFYLFSLLCMFFQAIVWQQALKHYPLSLAYPFMSLVNFVILIASAVLFGEGITVGNIAGLLLISIGIAVLSQEFKNGQSSDDNSDRNGGVK